MKDFLENKAPPKNGGFYFIDIVNMRVDKNYFAR
nr:MAG TPA: hypothetical protein [Bacteriophage sp.]